MQSQEFILLGQVSGKIDSVLEKQKEQTGHIGQLFKGLDDVKETLGKLPCSAHTDKIGELQDWQSCHNGEEKKAASAEKLEGVKAGLSLKTGLLLLAASGAGSIITGVIVYWLTCGVK